MSRVRHLMAKIDSKKGGNSNQRNIPPTIVHEVIST